MAHTATFTTNPLRYVGEVAYSALTSVGAFLIHLAEAGPRMREIERLNAQSEEQLAARGLTREGEIRRIFGAHFYL